MKCCAIGVRSSLLRCTIFPPDDDEENIPRTDAGFRQRIYGQHHRNYIVRTERGKRRYEPIISPLLRLPIDIVQDVIVADSLHLLHLGIMKRLIMFYKDGHDGCNFKCTAVAINDISTIITAQKMPVEMHRIVRGLDVISHWKASECAVFLNYIGIGVLKNFIPADHFKMFIYLFCGTTICSSGYYRRFLPVAQKLFDSFVMMHYKLFQSATSNVHNITHIVSECERFGDLSTISSYPFENHLYKIKNLLRSGRLPLEQVANRLTEMLFVNENAKQKNVKFPILFNAISIENNTKYTSVTLRDGLTLINNDANKWFLTFQKEIISMKYVNQSGICGDKLNVLNNVFDEPFNSSLINVFKTNEPPNLGPTKVIPFDDVLCKFVTTNIYKQIIFIPLHHTLPSNK